MTLRQIIEKLRKEGHEVEYIEEKPLKSKKGGKRTTGQIRITKLDNITIKGNNKSLLNKKAREMSGESLSSRKVEQLEKARANIQPKTRVDNFPADLEKDLKRIQRKIRQSEKKKAEELGKEVEKSKSTLRIKKKTIRKKLKEEGYEETKRALKAIERYWEGYANESSIQALREILNSMVDALTDSTDRYNISMCIDILNNIADRLGEYALQDLLSAVYDFQNGVIKSNDLLKIFESKEAQKGQIKGLKHNL